MDLTKTYREKYEDLRQDYLRHWVLAMVACLTSLLALVPIAGYLRILRSQRRGEKSSPSLSLESLLAPFDHLFPLLVLLVGSMLFFFAVGVVESLVGAIIRPLGALVGLARVFLITPLFIVGLTYAILLVCEQKLDPITAAKKALMGIQERPKDSLLLGLGAMLLALPFGLGLPLGLGAIVDQFARVFPALQTSVSSAQLSPQAAA